MPGKEKLFDPSLEEHDLQDQFSKMFEQVPAAVDTVDNEIHPIDVVGLYFQEINRFKLLTHKEEIASAKKYEDGRIASIDLGKEGLDQDSRYKLEMIKNEGETARQTLINHNLRLVVSVAKKYQSFMPIMEGIQEGNLGLMKATDDYDYRKGFRFSTYAYWWIRQSIVRAIANKSREIRLPVHLQEKIVSFYKTMEVMRQEFGREPSIKEIAAGIGKSSAYANDLYLLSKGPLYLESKLSDEEDSATLGDLISDVKENVPDIAKRNEVILKVREAVGSINDERLRFILDKRFGLSDRRMYTLEEVGDMMGVTRERVRQLEVKALQKLRHPARARLLRGLLD